MKSKILIVSLFLSLQAFAQVTDTTTTKETFKIVEVPAEFPGGVAAFYMWISKTMKYPSEARNQGIEGRVYVQFEIDEEGNIDPESVIVANSDHPLLDQESLRVFKQSPQWIPARMTFDENSKKVRCRMVMPIIYKLAGKPQKKKKKR